MKPIKWLGIAVFGTLIAACGGGNGVTYTVGGTISGLNGTLVLQSGGISKSFNTNGVQTLSDPIPEGTSYALTVRTQPTGQTCTVTNGTGTVHADVTNVQVTCISATRTYATVSTLVSQSSGSLTYAEGVAADASGNLYVADMMAHVIRKVTPAGVVTTFAGSGSQGSADGAGTAASFNYPNSLTVDGSGNVYVADTSNNMIRKITPAGVVTTLAGSTSQGSTDGTGSAARFWMPSGLATDASGNVYVSDGNNNMIRKITPAGVVTTLAGSTTSGHADGTGTAASFYSPRGIAVDSAGNVFVADSWNYMVRKITPTGVVTTVAGSTTSGSANGIGAAATFSSPHGIVVDSSGNLYVTDADMIRKITPTAEVSTFAGISTGSADTDGPIASATFHHLQGITIDASSGVMYGIESYALRKIE